MENIEIIEYLDKSSPKDLALLYQKKYRESKFLLDAKQFDCFSIVYAEQQHLEFHHSALVLEVLVRYYKMVSMVSSLGIVIQEKNTRIK